MAMLAAGLGGAAIGGVSSLVGSGKQADATKYAANQQSQAAANSLAFNQQVYGTTLANEKPFVAAGDTAVNALQAGIQNGSLTQPWTTPFSFSGVNLQNDPAYNFDLQQGQQAIQRSAAAQGGLVSGGALKDLNDYSQGFASNQFEQSYQNALAQYQQAYNIFQNNQSNQFNRLSGVAGLGQNAVTGTATSGNAAAGTGALVNSSTANALSNLYTGQGNAAAAATMAAGNALSGGLNNVANYLALQSGSSYGNQFSAPNAPLGTVSPAQWAAYGAGSTPAGALDAFGNFTPSVGS